MLNTNIPDILNFNLSYGLLIAFSILLILVSIKIIFCNDLLKITIFMSAFSLIIGVIYLLMDAPDVAMTEVALGACLSTVILISAIKIFGSRKQDIVESVDVDTRAEGANPMVLAGAMSDNVRDLKSFNKKKMLAALALCISFIGVLLKTLLALPQYGLLDSPIANGASKYYLENTANDIGIDSVVAGILASYRGYDTLGETIVILIAGIAVLLIFAHRE